MGLPSFASSALLCLVPLLKSKAVSCKGTLPSFTQSTRLPFESHISFAMARARGPRGPPDGGPAQLH
eukprot:9467110-Pyramimonas_sp.AAC.1